MRATELRLGNWVMIDPNNSPQQVVDVMCDCVTTENTRGAHYGLVDAIPLTEEILLKCEGYKQNYGIEINDTTQLDFVITNDGVYPFITQDGEFSGQLPTQVNLERIQHLHQLQNLFFALTGTELEINL